MLSATDRGWSPNRKYCSVIRGAQSGVEMVSRLNAIADPSGEIAGRCSSASGSSAITRRSPEARSTRSSTERSVASGPVTRHVVTRNRPSALMSNVASSNPASRSASPGCGVRSRRFVASNRCGSSGPMSWSQKRTGYPECRIALTLLALRKPRRRRSSSTSRAEARNGAPITVASAPRAVRTRLTPPGMLSTSIASPPPAGSRHSEAGGLSAPSAFSAVGREDTNSRSPSTVNAGAESPFDPRVSRRAGFSPARVDFPDGADIVGALVVEFGHGGHHPRAVGRHGQAGNAWQCEVVVEVVECRCGHESLVTQRGTHDASRAPDSP